MCNLEVECLFEKIHYNTICPDLLIKKPVPDATAYTSPSLICFLEYRRHKFCVVLRNNYNEMILKHDSSYKTHRLMNPSLIFSIYI